MFLNMIKGVLAWVFGCFGLYLFACVFLGVDSETAVNYWGYATVGGVIVIPVFALIDELRKELNDSGRKSVGSNPWKGRLNNSGVSLERVDRMDGHDFEYFFAAVLERVGWRNVSVTKGSGDYGIDILAVSDGIKVGLQCKRFDGPVGVSAIQEVSAGIKYYKCETGVVVTNSYFTDAAKRLAKANGIVLFDRDVLAHFMKQAGL